MKPSSLHLVAEREEPAGVRLRLLRDVAAGASGAEDLEAGPQGVVDPDRAVGARDLVAEIHAAAKRPTDLELADGARFEVDQRHRVVVVGDRMDERVGVAHDLDRPVALADEPADDLDAVAPEVDDRATTGQPAVPEPRGMRSRVRLA